MHDLTRRGTLLSGLALAACAPQTAPNTTAYTSPPDDPRFAAIEQRIGGRVGVAAWNTGTGDWIGRRVRERFAMCSTFKWALAAAQLHMAQNGGPPLGEQVRFNQSDMLSYAPVARQHLERGWMTIEEACAGAVVMSDNTAANLLWRFKAGRRASPAFFARTAMASRGLIAMRSNSMTCRRAMSAIRRRLIRWCERCGASCSKTAFSRPHIATC